jgi:hypothetical protein
VIAGLLAAAGIGTAAYAAKSISNSTDRLAKANGPKARVTLPTRDPNDGETSLEVSMPDINLSKNILTGLNRDLRGRLREENKERVGHYRRNKARLKNLGINMNDEGEILGRNAEQQEDMIVNA